MLCRSREGRSIGKELLSEEDREKERGRERGHHEARQVMTEMQRAAVKIPEVPRSVKNRGLGLLAPHSFFASKCSLYCSIENGHCRSDFCWLPFRFVRRACT